ncbi:hypothetical protein [Streptomyces sp. MZ04]|uniref:hypothetical protein n=1 Tax=Streptomyces sp. MZ04 TaxID=2559236 RepID=UPI00107EC7D1|nr:hypothetical protein [Streptomyces sp. MZ04]TGB06027.1 hypothetical protein E2651_23955 [Streptomyces sp. MZ04]
MILRKPLILLTACVSLALAAASPAVAGTEFGDGNVSGKKNGDTVAAVAKITYTSSGNNNGGPVASVETNWTPPACWYAPEWKATEFQEYRERLYFGARHDPDAPRDVRTNSCRGERDGDGRGSAIHSRAPDSHRAVARREQ